jgi:HEPN domain-containing protein
MREKGICPVLNYNHPIGILGTYCWFRSKVIASELEALDYTDLADEIKPLLEILKETFEEIKRLHNENRKSIIGAGWNGIFKDGKFEYENYSTYEEIVEEFENTIKWLEMLMENNCGFRAWF